MWLVKCFPLNTVAMLHMLSIFCGYKLYYHNIIAGGKITLNCEIVALNREIKL